MAFGAFQVTHRTTMFAVWAAVLGIGGEQHQECLDGMSRSGEKEPGRQEVDTEVMTSGGSATHIREGSCDL
jgi:hypothetical protein